MADKEGGAECLATISCPQIDGWRKAIEVKWLLDVEGDSRMVPISPRIGQTSFRELSRINLITFPSNKAAPKC